MKAPRPPVIERRTAVPARPVRCRRNTPHERQVVNVGIAPNDETEGRIERAEALTEIVERGSYKNLQNNPMQKRDRPMTSSFPRRRPGASETAQNPQNNPTQRSLPMRTAAAAGCKASPAPLTSRSASPILYLMVKYRDAALDRTFAALADPTRRALLARLDEQEGVTVSELARPFPVSLPAIMKHLDVLSDAGLITRTKTGRTVACRLTAGPMEEAVSWLNRYQRFWSEQLDRLAAFVEKDSWPTDPAPPPPPPPSNPASPSNVVSMRRPAKSTPRGRTPRR
jgi:DNA-binding transcriptional ArsR family regulator